MKGQCPRPLDDGDLKLFFRFSGGARRDRTVDLFTASEALSQLSYSPRKEAHTIRICPLPVNKIFEMNCCNCDVVAEKIRGRIGIK